MAIKNSTVLKKVLGTAAALLFAVSANSALAAQSYSYAGVITDCNPAICSLVPVFTSDPVVGTITFPADAGGSTGLLDNTFMDFSFLVGGVIPVEFPSGDPLAGVYLTSAGITIEADKTLLGTLEGAFVGGTLGGLLGAVVFDTDTGAATVTVGGGTVFVASVEGTFSPIPIPAAAWLFGSALLGLVGVARRKAKA